MPVINGGDDDTAPRAGELAPVIPLFGRPADAPRRRPSSEPVWRASWADDAAASAESTGAVRERPLRTIGSVNPPDQHSMSLAERAAASRGHSTATPTHIAAADGSAADAEAADAVDPQAANDAAEALLLRRLRTRQLSVSEARSAVIAVGMTDDAADELLSRFERLGYLDDAALAEQLVHAAVERKGQGRQAISPLLAKRGVPREVIDAVLSNLPDDDLERALEFARTKARSLGGRDREAALRRLLGQLARRGYPSSVSMAAARQAIDEI
jgi:regulatory protein